jgi:uncharacterized protein
LGFEERLRRIRGQGAAPAADPVAPPVAGDSLVERLRRLAVGRTPPVGGHDRGPDEAALAHALGADTLAPGVLRLERCLPTRLRHGRVYLGPVAGTQAAWSLDAAQRHRGSGAQPAIFESSASASPDFACAPSGLPRTGAESLPASPAHPLGPWLFLDTETSGLTGGTGTWAFLTGLLRAATDGWLLRQYLLTRLDAESAYLALIGNELAAPARLVTYNGRSFDAPLLATRFRLAGWRDPLVGIPHLDLLGPTRRAFARRWPDCRLATAESRLLGFERSGDLPGSAAPAAWLGWLRRGETGPLAAVLRHNRDDLLSLAGLLPALDAVYLDPGAHGAEVRAVAAAWQSRDPVRALRILAANRRELDAPGLLDLARLYRRAGDWVAAIGIWEGLAAGGEAHARAALARFHEHRSGDLRRALELADALPPGPERERRRERLRVKLGRGRSERQIELAIEPSQAL